MNAFSRYAPIGDSLCRLPILFLACVTNIQNLTYTTFKFSIASFIFSLAINLQLSFYLLSTIPLTCKKCYTKQNETKDQQIRFVLSIHTPESSVYRKG